MELERERKPLRVALACYDQRALRVQKRYLEERCSELVCECWRSGRQMLEHLRAHGCDVVVLGGPLEDMDEEQLFCQLRRQPARPMLLLFGAGGRCRSALACLREVYIARPSQLEELARELCRAAGRSPLSVEEFCRKLYAAWGVGGCDTGCGYLTSAVRAACGAKERLAIRKELLERVSEQYHVSVAAVDSGLRRMIDACEEQSAPGWLDFKQKSGLAGEKPSVGALIYAVRGQLAQAQG